MLFYLVGENIMTLWLGVENFGKIRDAKICINKCTVLVGPNNCGKSFLMQLADGINEYIIKISDEVDLNYFKVDEKEGYQKYSITSQNSDVLSDAINNRLAYEKKEAVQYILGKDISIERLYIEWKLEENEEYNIYAFDREKVSIEYMQSVLPEKNEFIDKMIWPDRTEGGLVCLAKKNLITNQEKIWYISNMMGRLDDKFMQRVVFRAIFSNESLYMPASRNGLILMYRDFFANKVDDAVEFSMHYGERKENDAVMTETGLTKPVYKFLRFLQTYNKIDKSRLESELQFFDKNIIEGNIVVNEQGYFSYQSDKDDLLVPMYLASSMINELVPIYLAITSNRRYRRLVIDEIESSLHPQKQMEVVRMLNRLSNQGYQFIISTHSDTVVSKINNLYRLSKGRCSTNDLQCVGVEQADLIEPSNLYVYEFDITEDGRSSVREVKYGETGFQFDLFTNSALNLYNESKKIGEILSEYEN